MSRSKFIIPQKNGRESTAMLSQYSCRWNKLLNFILNLKTNKYFAKYKRTTYQNIMERMAQYFHVLFGVIHLYRKLQTYVS